MQGNVFSSEAPCKAIVLQTENDKDAMRAREREEHRGIFSG